MIVNDVSFRKFETLLAQEVIEGECIHVNETRLPDWEKYGYDRLFLSQEIINMPHFSADDYEKQDGVISGKVIKIIDTPSTTFVVVQTQTEGNVIICLG